jgi:hypothetical protein
VRSSSRTTRRARLCAAQPIRAVRLA